MCLCGLFVSIRFDRKVSGLRAGLSRSSAAKILVNVIRQKNGMFKKIEDL